ncbi:MAG: 1-acyl-sn-glycerol-3-phosphate acyltransferase [Rhodospirillaceae bacterium]|nr:1-acyl-sn-glycerol-3-phosphate acyltransferase [Rhodospirillaceae bacterium]
MNTRVLTSEITLPTAPTDTVLACARFVFFLLFTVFIVLFISLLRVLFIGTAPVRRVYYRIMARVLGFELKVKGRQVKDRPMLIVCNHISYLDIVIVGAVVKGAFVARGDMADWPFFGLMAKAGRTVFIDRKRSSTNVARDAIQNRLDEGSCLIMFPESTSGDGNHMLPFKSALFTVAEKTVKGKPITVQPMSIAYTRLNGLPIGVGWRAFFAWYGDMTLGPHLWQALKMGRTTVEIEFHDPVTAADMGGRKALAAHCHKVTSESFSRLLSGRSKALTPISAP